MRRRALLATGLALAVVAGAACSDDEDPPPSADRRSTTTSASTSTSSTTSTTAVAVDGYLKARPDPDLPRQDIDINLRYPAAFTPEQVEVVQAWANYRHVFYATADPPDPDSELLSEVADARAATNLRQQLREFASEGLIVRIPDDGLFGETVTAASVDGDSAELRTCEVDSAQIVEATSGAIRDDRVITKAIGAELRLLNGSWRTTPGSEIARWEGDQEALCVDS